MKYTLNIYLFVWIGVSKILNNIFLQWKDCNFDIRNEIVYFANTMSIYMY